MIMKDGDRRARKRNRKNHVCADSGDHLQGSRLRTNGSVSERHNQPVERDNSGNRSGFEEQSDRRSDNGNNLRIHSDSNGLMQQRDSAGNGAGYKLEEELTLTAHTNPTITQRRTSVKVAEVRKQILAKKVTMSTDQTTTFPDVLLIASAHICLVAPPGTELACTVTGTDNVVTLAESAITDTEVLVIAVENTAS